MDEKRLIVQLQRLTSITDEEWIVVSDKCNHFLRSRLKNKTSWGVHSESNLGINAFDFYFVGAVEKLYNGTCTWFFGKFNLEEQIIRIMNSAISDNVRKAKITNEQKLEIEYDDKKICSCKGIEENGIDEDEYATRIQIIRTAIQNDPELSTYFSLVHEGCNSKEISQEMNIPIPKVYKLTEKLKAVILKELSYAK